MCGIAGLWQAEADGSAGALARAMGAAIAHRGPDAEGLWADAAVGLSHQRLAILDLSEAGAQPMVCATGRYRIVYNGEIYNHLALRRALTEAGAAPNWRGTSDTETLLAAITHWGLDMALQRSFGMFALCLWDHEAGRMYLARDRMGEKPLYWTQGPAGLRFGSEPVVFGAAAEPATAPDPASDPAPDPIPDPIPDPGALSAYLRQGYVPDDQGITPGLNKVAPGQILQFDAPCAVPAARLFWRLGDHAAPAARDGTLRAMQDLLRQVTSEQMLSDVPLGSFLSGGVDSSLVTALMQAEAPSSVRSFSIGFPDPAYNEAPHAAAVAAHLGTDHTEFMVTEDEALAAIPDLAEVYAEPFSDPSQLPTLLLCRLARAEVTVALTGDGGDEVFGGYNRYLFGPRLWRMLAPVPRPLRPLVGAFARGVHRTGLAPRILPRLGLSRSMADKIGRIGQVAAEADSLASLYARLTQSFDDPEAWLAPSLRAALTGAAVSEPIGGDPIGGELIGGGFDTLEGADWMMAMDSSSYLPGDILVKVDRAAMSCALETRAPFLDGRVVEAAWALPDALRIAGGQGKQALRQILDEHVPRDLIERPKQGFAMPLDRWLRGGLRDWAGSLLEAERVAAQGLLDPVPVAALWRAQLAGENHGPRLWTLLMLCAWADRRDKVGAC